MSDQDVTHSHMVSEVASCAGRQLSNFCAVPNPPASISLSPESVKVAGEHAFLGKSESGLMPAPVGDVLDFCRFRRCVLLGEPKAYYGTRGDMFPSYVRAEKHTFIYVICVYARGKKEKKKCEKRTKIAARYKVVKKAENCIIEWNLQKSISNKLTLF